MPSQLTLNMATYGILAATAVVAFTLPPDLGPASASAGPKAPGDTMTLTGIVRDFRAAHGDFDLTLAGGNGHYAGNVAQTLSASDKPTFSGSGYKVSTQWRTVAAHPIAPHMYLNAAIGRQVRVASAPTISGSPIVDTFDSTIGPYGGSNIGVAPIWVTGAAMPAITQPTGMPAQVGDVIYSGNTTTTLSGNVNCQRFILQGLHTLKISGNVRIVASELFKIENYSKLELLTGATLTIWTHKDLVFQNNSDVNVNTANPSRFVINHTGTGELLVENSTRLYAAVRSVNAKMNAKNSANFYGTFTGKTVEISNDCGVHIDTNGYGRVCGVMTQDTAGAAGSSSTGGIGSASTFAQWYTDTMGVNLSKQHDLTLTLDGSGVWEHHDDTFLPIDGLLFGNEGQAHNYLFTFAFTTTFTHHGCDNRFFEFQGADDAWLFINGQLVLDIGGLVTNQLQRIDVDRLTLTNGQDYRIDFFYAQRQTSNASFHLRTNLDLNASSSSYAVSAGMD